MVKAIERGENPTEDRGGKLAGARTRDSIKFGVVMDDKLVTINMAWATIRSFGEIALSEYILKLMRGTRESSCSPPSS